MNNFIYSDRESLDYSRIKVYEARRIHVHLILVPKLWLIILAIN